MDAKEAIATSLLVVGVTSAVGAISHVRAGRVQWRTGLLFGAAGMAGAYAGGLLARFIPGTVLLIAFAVMMIATAVAMLRGRKNTTRSERGADRCRCARSCSRVVRRAGHRTGRRRRRLPGGAGAGAARRAAHARRGRHSLVVIAMKSFAGLAGYLASVQIDWRMAAWSPPRRVMGGLIGGRLTGMVDPDALRKAFGWFVLVMASVILAQEDNSAVGVAAAGADRDCRRNHVRLHPIRALLVAAHRRRPASNRCGGVTAPIYPRGYYGR